VDGTGQAGQLSAGDPGRSRHRRPAPGPGPALREAEERAGALQVGVDTVEFLGHRDGVIEYGLSLRRDIVRAMRRHRPEVVVTGAFSVRMVGGITSQADHRAVGPAARDAARDAGNR
jgi:LmbE family N-acetylglucosaminyl deacetylase